MKKIFFIWLTTFISLTLYSEPILDNPPASAGSDTAICEGQTHTLSGATATNYIRLLWTSSGTGSFNKPALLNPTYKPSAKDIVAGSVTLTLSVTGEAGYPDTTSSMVLTITRAPKVFAGGSDAIREGEKYALSYSSAENYTELNWSSSGTGFFNDFRDLHPTYVPSAEDIRFGSATLTLTATGKGTCPPAVSDMVLIIN